jgi:hypothetical protein
MSKIYVSKVNVARKAVVCVATLGGITSSNRKQDVHSSTYRNTLNPRATLTTFFANYS